MARPTTGPAYLDRLPGSAVAHQRARLIAEVLTGETRLVDAAAQLGVSTQRLHELRWEAFGALVAACEPKPVGRPPRQPVAEQDLAAQLAAREQELRDLRVRLELAGVREELAALGLTRPDPGSKKRHRRPKR